MIAMCIFFYCCCEPNSSCMDILYKRYFSLLRLLRSSEVEVEEKPEPKASRRSCRFVCVNLRGLHKNLFDLSLIARGGNVLSFLRLLSLVYVPSFGRPMQLLRGEADRFRELTVYMRDGAFWRILSAVISVDVVKS